MFAQLQATNTNGINNDRNSMLDQIAQDESNEARVISAPQSRVSLFVSIRRKF